MEILETSLVVLQKIKESYQMIQQFYWQAYTQEKNMSM